MSLTIKKIAQAKAESRPAMSVAQEQEMKAKARVIRAKLIEAEAQVPLAMAQASWICSGDYPITDPGTTCEQKMPQIFPSWEGLGVGKIYLCFS